MSQLLIIGSGLAGYTLAKEVRRLDQQIALTIISSDDGGFYSKPMLSNALAQKKTADDLLTTTADQMAQQLNARILTATTVHAVDSHAKRVATTSGSIDYERLVLAVGAVQTKPPLAGDGKDEVLTVNDLEDYRRFRTRLRGKRRVAIIGAGLIGCEFANDLAAGGFEVALIGLEKRPLHHLVPTQIGERLLTALTKLGVVYHGSELAKSVERRDDHFAVRLANDTAIEADVVLSATGLKPNVALAHAAGIHVNRGIVVNQLLETTRQDIFALGDCIEMDGHVRPYVMPLMTQARALARTLCGTPTPVAYPHMPVVVKTPAHPVTVLTPPDVAGQWQIDASNDGVRARYVDVQGRLRGFALSGDAVKEKMSLTKEVASD